MGLEPTHMLPFAFSMELLLELPKLLKFLEQVGTKVLLQEVYLAKRRPIYPLWIS